MTAFASDSALDLTVLADDAFDWLRRPVTEACAREIAAEQAHDRAEAALAAERRVLQRIRALAESGGAV